MRTKDEKEFYNLGAKMAGGKYDTSRKWWKAFFEVVVRELYTSGMVYLPKIGYFRLEHLEAGVQKQVDSKGEVHWYQVPERDKAVFVADDDFVNDINMRGVTKSYRKRAKAGELTLRDKERARRLREIIGEYEEIPERALIKQLKFVDEFDALMKKKRQEYERKLEETLKE